MGKKYLLYIHNKKFNEEQKKSALINKLLEIHYKPTPYDKIPKTLDFKPAQKINSSLCPHGLPWLTCKVSSCGIKGRNMGLT